MEQLRLGKKDQMPVLMWEREEELDSERKHSQQRLDRLVPNRRKEFILWGIVSVVGNDLAKCITVITGPKLTSLRCQPSCIVVQCCPLKNSFVDCNEA